MRALEWEREREREREMAPVSSLRVQYLITRVFLWSVHLLIDGSRYGWYLQGSTKLESEKIILKEYSLVFRIIREVIESSRRRVGLGRSIDKSYRREQRSVPANNNSVKPGNHTPSHTHKHTRGCDK